MIECPRAASRLILPSLVLAAVAAVAMAPTGPQVGAMINRMAAWASPPRDNIRPGTGGRYRKAERAWEESARRAIREFEEADGFVGPPRPDGLIPVAGDYSSKRM